MGKRVVVAFAVGLLVGSTVLAGGFGAATSSSSNGPGFGLPSLSSGGTAGTNSTASGGILDGLPGSFSLDPGNRSSGIDVSISVPNVGISFRGLGAHDGSPATGRISHGAISKSMARNAGAGACAVGLTGDDAPLDLSVDGHNSTASVQFSGNDSTGRNGGGHVNATRVVQQCSRGSNGG